MGEGREGDPGHGGDQAPLLLQALQSDHQVILQLLAAEAALQADGVPVAVQPRHVAPYHVSDKLWPRDTCLVTVTMQRVTESPPSIGIWMT